MSEGIDGRILIIKGILAERCGLNPDTYDEISEIFEEIQILDKAKDDALASGSLVMLTCDSCGCHPSVIYTTSKGRFCERCKPVS